MKYINYIRSLRSLGGGPLRFYGKVWVLEVLNRKKSSRTHNSLTTLYKYTNTLLSTNSNFQQIQKFLNFQQIQHFQEIQEIQ